MIIKAADGSDSEDRCGGDDGSERGQGGSERFRVIWVAAGDCGFGSHRAWQLLDARDAAGSGKRCVEVTMKVTRKKKENNGN